MDLSYHSRMYNTLAIATAEEMLKLQKSLPGTFVRIKQDFIDKNDNIVETYNLEAPYEFMIDEIKCQNNRLYAKLMDLGSREVLLMGILLENLEAV